MTRRVGDMVIIESENPQQCDYCGAIRELRPYGKDGATICHPCAVKPENKAETEKRFRALLDGAEGVI